MLRWIYDNKQWFFSGIGVIIASIASYFIRDLARFIFRKIRQRKVNILRSNVAKFRDSVSIIEAKWIHQRQSSNPDFDLAASILSQAGEQTLTFWKEVSGIFGNDSSFVSDLQEAVYSLNEASKKRQYLSFDSVKDFWSTGEQAFSMLMTAVNKLPEYHKTHWHKRMFWKRRGK